MRLSAALVFLILKEGGYRKREDGRGWVGREWSGKNWRAEYRGCICMCILSYKYARKIDRLVFKSAAVDDRLIGR